MLKKDITFIYMDTPEKMMYQPIMEEAEKRGYKVRLTTNKFVKCEIGFYCQHVNFPQYSKFSIIMLHDIIQQYGNWPNIWHNEPWDKYDVGILPSDQWVDNWNKCSMKYYANPKKGMYKVGWPKADTVIKYKNEKYKAEFFKKYNLNPNKKTVLYAPAWENDGKQDDFVQSMKKLDVNILVKQYDASPEIYPEIAKNIQEMYDLHKDDKRVTILPSTMNIFEAIAASDILVSEESSTMCEAVMMGIPAVSVSNWLIPDVTPSRFPECSYDFVILTLKEDLTKKIKEIIENYDVYKKQTEEFSKKNFSNIGKSASMIMDIVDDLVENKECRYKALEPQPKQKLSRKEKKNFKRYQFKIQFWNQMRYHYCQNKIFNAFYTFARKVKHKILRKKQP